MSLEQMQLLETLRGVEGYDAIMQEAGNMIGNLVMGELANLKGGIESIRPLRLGNITYADPDRRRTIIKVEPVNVHAFAIDFLKHGDNDHPDRSQPSVILMADGLLRTSFDRIYPEHDPEDNFNLDFYDYRDIPLAEYKKLGGSTDWIKYGRDALRAIQWHNERFQNQV